MEATLGELLFNEWLVYVDDIIVYSSSIDDHLHRLQNVYNKLIENNLKLKPEKCRFFQTEGSFLGHTVTPNGVKKDDKKIESIKEWPVPKNVKDLRRFLGLTGYLRKYVPHYAQWVNPLSDLLKGYSNKKRKSLRKQEERGRAMEMGYN